MKRKIIESECQWCGKDFTHRKDHPNKYCSRKCAGYSRRHQVLCEFCGRRVKKSRNKYCGKLCVKRAKAQKSRITLLCDECGVLFSRHRCHIHKINNFCSNECYRIWQIGRSHPKSEPIGTKKIRKDSSGRERWWIKIALPNIWRQNARQRWVRYNGVIKEGHIIHHRNRDTKNDSLDNLACMSRSDHLRIHRKEITKRL